MNNSWTLPILTAFLIDPLMAQPPQQLSRESPEVLPRVSITVLVDNMAGGGPLLGEWGAAFLIKTDKEQFLFDTGGGRVLLGNARALGVDLSKTRAVVISHEHGDHTLGLDSALRASGRVDLYLHPAGFETRYWKDEATPVPHTLPYSRRELSQRVRKLVESTVPIQIGEGVTATGQIPRICEFEDTGLKGLAFLDEKLTKPDPILDDQAVFFRVPEGVVIVLGCGHAGLVNTMAYVCELTGERRIHAVIGGTHLVSASPERLQKTVEALRMYDVQKIMLSHCTGVRAYAELASAFPGRCSWPAAGTVIRFGGDE